MSQYDFGGEAVVKKAGIWFLLSCKRYGRRLSFLLILLLLPLLCLALRPSGGEKTPAIRIAVCALGGQEGQLGGRLLADLTGPEREEGMFRFYLCPDEQQLKDEVASRRAECGFVIGEALEEKLNQKDYKRCISIYSAPSTVTAALAGEVVLAAMIQLYDQDLFTDYVLKHEIFETIAPAGSSEREAIAREATGLYDKWSTNESTFRFTYAYQNVDSQIRLAEEAATGTVFPVRGVVAVLVFITGLYGAVMDGMDERRGMFLPLSYRERLFCRLACMAGPVCMAAVSGLAALWCGHTMGAIVREVLIMMAYVILVVGFSWILGRICRDPQVLCCLIPFFVIGSLLLCPVIVDAGAYVPELKAAGRLFLPYHYLRWF